jgi:hypothetical protein
MDTVWRQATRTSEISTTKFSLPLDTVRDAIRETLHASYVSQLQLTSADRFQPLRRHLEVTALGKYTVSMRDDTCTNGW